VEFSYRSYDLVEQTLWDQFNWDEADWADESGEIFDWDNIEFKILSKNVNLDNFTTQFILRRL